MRQYQPLADEEETQDAICLNLELENLIRSGQMLELVFIPDLPGISHPNEQRGEFLLACKRHLFQPFLGGCRPTVSNVELNAEHGTAVDEPSGRMSTGRIRHAVWIRYSIYATTRSRWTAYAKTNGVGNLCLKRFA